MDTIGHNLSEGSPSGVGVSAMASDRDEIREILDAMADAKCILCSKVFMGKLALQKHMKDMHYFGGVATM